MSQCIRHQEFQLARLIPTQSQSGLVIAFDIDVRAIQEFCQPRQVFNHGWQVRNLESG